MKQDYYKMDKKEKFGWSQRPGKARLFISPCPSKSGEHEAPKFTGL